MSVFPWPEAVAIFSSRSDVVAGLRPRFQEQWVGPHTVEWTEGGHIRMFQLGQVLEEDGEHYKFRDTRGDTFELRPLTLDLYEKHVRKRTVGQPHFETLAELLAAMRREW